MIFRVTRTLKINRVWLKEKNKDGKEEEKNKRHIEYDQSKMEKKKKKERQLEQQNDIMMEKISLFECCLDSFTRGMIVLTMDADKGGLKGFGNKQWKILVGMLNNLLLIKKKKKKYAKQEGKQHAERMMGKI